MAQQDVKFNILANVQGMEQVSMLINRVGALEKETNRLRTANQGLAASTETVIQSGKRYNNAIDAQSKALRNARQGSQMAMMQLNDFATSVSTGASPITAFNQQIGQLGYSMSLMGGNAGKFGRFLAGPWGLAVIGATTLLGMFTKGMADAGKESASFADIARGAFDSITANLGESLAPAIEGLAPVIETVGFAFTTLGEWAIAALKGIMLVINRVVGAIFGVVNGAIVAIRGGAGAIMDVLAGVANAAIRIVNFALAHIEKVLNTLGAAMNAIFSALGMAYQFPAVQLGRLTEVTNKWAGSAVGLAKDVGTAFKSAFENDIFDMGDIAARTKISPKKGKDKKGGGADKGGKSGSDDAEKEAKRLKAIQDSLTLHLIKSRAFWADYWLDRQDEMDKASAESFVQRNKELETLAAVTYDKYIKPVDAALEELAASYENVGMAISDSFKGMITGATSWKDAMRGLIGTVIDELWRLFVVQKIVGMVSSLLGGATPGGGFISSVSSGLSGVMGAFGGARATGGSVTSGKGYVVGENGPEWFEPGGNGTIIPNGNMRSGGGAGALSIHVDARGSADPAAVRAQVEQGILQAAPAIIAAAQARTVSGLRRPRLGGAMQ